MVKDFLKAVGVNKISELFFMDGRLSFGLNLLYVKAIDIFHGTDFGGKHFGRILWDEAGTSRERANDYSATPRNCITTLKRMYIKKNDSIMDMGCGKGLAMHYMSKFPFRRIGGIELSKKFCQSAKRNLTKLHTKEDIGRFEIICGDAGKYKYYENYDFFFIYNSFPRQVVKEVVQSICESINKKPRKVIILYLYPEFPREITNGGRFILLEKGGKNEIRCGMHIYVNKECRNQKIYRKES
ncbi:MAG: class I SAM-dependent methyltransferase [Lachnospiraceae bacterium]|nr:class I SAM-dependent methyltransferase [Lachnospiraceae bacterium]